MTAEATLQQCQMASCPHPHPHPGEGKPPFASRNGCEVVKFAPLSSCTSHHTSFSSLHTPLRHHYHCHYSEIHKHSRTPSLLFILIPPMTGKLLGEHQCRPWIRLPSFFRIRVSSLPSFRSDMHTMSQRRHGYSPHHCIQITSFQCQGERVEFDSFRWFFIGNWGTAGETPCAPLCHLRVSHDQTTL